MNGIAKKINPRPCFSFANEPPRSEGTFAYGLFRRMRGRGRFIFISLLLWKRCEKHRLTFYTFALIVK
jgi:hypothetical protein